MLLYQCDMIVNLLNRNSQAAGNGENNNAINCSNVRIANFLYYIAFEFEDFNYVLLLGTVGQFISYVCTVQATLNQCKTDDGVAAQPRSDGAADAKEVSLIPNAVSAVETVEEPWDWQKVSEKLMERIEELEKQLQQQKEGYKRVGITNTCSSCCSCFALT